MKITLVAPGLAPVPPGKYGGIELVIWNIRNVLVDSGHQVGVVNVRDSIGSIRRRLRIIRQVNAAKPDIVHIHASKYFQLARFMRGARVLFTDHCPQVSRADYPYHRRALQKDTHIVCLSERIREHYLAVGARPDCAHVIPNGLTTEQYRFTEQPKHKARSIYLAIVSKRKRQHLYWGLPGLDFAGPIKDPTQSVGENYLGEWSRQQVREQLTEYANLVLLSEAEVAAALVCMEALASGLGLVISQTCVGKLDTSLPFIDVIAERDIHNRALVANIIAKNRAKSLGMRAQIKEYAKNFDIKRTIANRYIPLLNAIVQGGDRSL